MDFWKAVLSLARRRHIGPPIVALALALAGLTYFLAPTHYVSSALMVLTTPTSGGSLDPEKPDAITNPLLQFSDGLKTTSGILIQAVNTLDAMARLGAPEGSSTKITVDDGSSDPELLGTSTTGPFIYVKVDAASAAVAADTVRRVQAQLRADLLNRQRKLRAPKVTFITISDVAPPSAPKVDDMNKWQFAGAALFLGLFVGFGCAYAATRIKDNRRARAGLAPAAPAVVPSAAQAAAYGSPLARTLPGAGGAADASGRTPDRAPDRARPRAPDRPRDRVFDRDARSAPGHAPEPAPDEGPDPAPGPVPTRAPGRAPGYATASAETTGDADGGTDGGVGADAGGDVGGDADDTQIFVVVVDEPAPPPERREPSGAEEHEERSDGGQPGAGRGESPERPLRVLRSDDPADRRKNIRAPRAG